MKKKLGKAIFFTSLLALSSSVVSSELNESGASNTVSPQTASPLCENYPFLWWCPSDVR